MTPITEVSNWHSQLRERVYAEMQSTLSSWSDLKIPLKIKSIPEEKWHETTEKIRCWIQKNCPFLTQQAASKINEGDLFNMRNKAFEGIALIGVQKVRAQISNQIKLLDLTVLFSEKDLIEIPENDSEEVVACDSPETRITLSDLTEEKDCVEIRKTQKTEYEQLIDKDELLKQWQKNPEKFWELGKRKRRSLMAEGEWDFI